MGKDTDHPANGRSCPDPAGYPSDRDMLDWIEQKQAIGEWISNAIHWDGRYIRDCIAAEMEEEKENGNTRG